MVSKDVNNILQRFGLLIFEKKIMGEITYKIIKIYISPEFVNTDYKDYILYLYNNIIGIIACN